MGKFHTGRFEKITKIDGYEVTLLTSYNDIEIYIETGDNSNIYLVQNEQVIFRFYRENDDLCVAEEYNKL